MFFLSLHFFSIFKQLFVWSHVKQIDWKMKNIFFCEKAGLVGELDFFTIKLQGKNKIQKQKNESKERLSEQWKAVMLLKEKTAHLYQWLWEVWWLSFA